MKCPNSTCYLGKIPDVLSFDAGVFRDMEKNYLLLLIPQYIKYLNYMIFHISAKPPRRAALPFFGGDYFILTPLEAAT